MKVKIIPCVLVRDGEDESALVAFDGRFVTMRFKVFEARGVKIPFIKDVDVSTRCPTLGNVHVDAEVLKPKHLGVRTVNYNKGNYKVSLPKACKLPRKVEVYKFGRCVVLQY